MRRDMQNGSGTESRTGQMLVEQRSFTTNASLISSRPGEGWHVPFHQALRSRRGGLQRLVHHRIDLGYIETLARLEADPLQLRNNRLIRQVGRVELEKFGA